MLAFAYKRADAHTPAEEAAYKHGITMYVWKARVWDFDIKECPPQWTFSILTQQTQTKEQVMMTWFSKEQYAGLEEDPRDMEWIKSKDTAVNLVIEEMSRAFALDLIGRTSDEIDKECTLLGPWTRIYLGRCLRIYGVSLAKLITLTWNVPGRQQTSLLNQLKEAAKGTLDFDWMTSVLGQGDAKQRDKASDRKLAVAITNKLRLDEKMATTITQNDLTSWKTLGGDHRSEALQRISLAQTQKRLSTVLANVVYMYH
ncbi:hypothetical protein AGMMS49949_08860 [Alphaproteobacteria bacterium]|nr:hypothetical protein AGMMS49949_08860 [Alphaproteobacteria bacterium]GHS99865.1 hypothetical protein AGMMS50296_8110 [Alphaproteobacteria bacterium]